MIHRPIAAACPEKVLEIHFQTPTSDPLHQKLRLAPSHCASVGAPGECDADSSLRSSELEGETGTKGQDDKDGLHTGGRPSE